jgi:hypothetical protein
MTFPTGMGACKPLRDRHPGPILCMKRIQSTYLEDEQQPRKHQKNDNDQAVHFSSLDDEQSDPDQIKS